MNAPLRRGFFFCRAGHLRAYQVWEARDSGVTSPEVVERMTEAKVWEARDSGVTSPETELRSSVSSVWKARDHLGTAQFQGEDVGGPRSKPPMARQPADDFAPTKTRKYALARARAWGARPGPARAEYGDHREARRL